MNYHYQIAKSLANMLDNQFAVGSFRFGLAPLIGLIPVVGDSLDALLSLYIVWIALQLNVPRVKISQMVFNIFINYLIGLIPVLGDATYLLRRINLKNLRIIQNYYTPRIV
jgi:hypothetical protein